MTSEQTMTSKTKRLSSGGTYFTDVLHLYSNCRTTDEKLRFMSEYYNKVKVHSFELHRKLIHDLGLEIALEYKEYPDTLLEELAKLWYIPIEIMQEAKAAAKVSSKHIAECKNKTEIKVAATLGPVKNFKQSLEAAKATNYIRSAASQAKKSSKAFIGMSLVKTDTEKEIKEKLEREMIENMLVAMQAVADAGIKINQIHRERILSLMNKI